MNSVSNHTAGTKAGRFARCALRSALACALVLGASGAALAQQYGDRRDDPAMQQQGGRGAEHERSGGRFQLPQERDPRYDVRAYEEQRRMQQYQQQQQQQQDQRDARRGSGRMTPDERRDLRRQINEAGMDLYPPRR
ncbi:MULTISPECIES: hypothetical protein [unclassified Massilia]|uniref:hypothetical protein n=1 Tax=unclassified Massilia TaxID=2609279 RepID=UPI00068DA8D7|nr:MULTISPECIES: hypothetical protein [unclassified Massilia]AWG45873.1 hypothetical protein AM586_27975 [Massilia sp. WG5]